jgi:hypothetical protein
LNDAKSTAVVPTSTVQTPISNEQANQITHQDAAPQLNQFIRSLQMRRPVSTDRASELVEHLVKLQMASDDVRIADQMRDDGWEAELSDGETLTDVAKRAFAYLSNAEGISLFNFFVRTYAKTSGEMFD